MYMIFADGAIDVPDSLPQPNTSAAEIQVILGILFGVIGAIALLMVAVSGLRYITSDGDPQKAASARNGVIYALVGVAIALTAEGIIVFVLNRL